MQETFREAELPSNQSISCRCLSYRITAVSGIVLPRNLNVKLFMFHVSCSACKCNGHASMCNPSNGKCFCTTKGIKGDRCHLWVLSSSSCFLLSWLCTLTCPLLSTQAAVVRKLSNFLFMSICETTQICLHVEHPQIFPISWWDL